MKEQDPKNPNQEPKRIESDLPQDDGTILLPETLKERMPALYSQEKEQDPTIICKFLTRLDRGLGTLTRVRLSMRMDTMTPTKKR